MQCKSLLGSIRGNPSPFPRPHVTRAASTGVERRPDLSAEELCARAREFTETGSGYFTPPRPELFSDEFIFRGPVIGPLNKKDYLETLGSFQVYKSFPDIQSNSFGYCVDPTEPARVRFFVRQTGTNTAPVTLLENLPFPATNKQAVVGPEAYSILFDEEGRVKLLTVGYPVDFDAPGTNSNKLGAVFGLLAAVGINLPTGQVFAAAQGASKQLQDIGVLKTPRSISKWEDIPQWYKDYCPKREGAAGVSW